MTVRWPAVSRANSVFGSVRLRHSLLVILSILVALLVAAVVFARAASHEILRWRGDLAATERLVTGILVTRRGIPLLTSPRAIRASALASGQRGTRRYKFRRGLQTQHDGAGRHRADLVRGLPRSNADHATNGMAFSADGRTLYVAQGANTNEGAPSEYFGRVPEYALSGAILAIDLKRIGASTNQLPTLDDPDRSGEHDEHDPFGGNSGLNQARIVKGGPAQVYACGVSEP